uniref:ATP synthase F0 subunit 8 n=1 Tax=Diartiger fossulatus TaxID=1535458 RepID=A0A0S2M7A9_9COLE|nr:ATP synthase F0 subunit 8 [Diartiger fossulatus]
MPQMAPLNWTMLMIFFMVNLIMFNILNYFFLLYNFKYNKNQNNKILMNWMW